MEPWKARVYAGYHDTAPGARTDAGFLAVQRRHYLQRYRRFLPPDKAAPILDIGCGAGGFLDVLQSIGYSCLEGVDLSPSQVHAAAARGLTGVTLGSAVEYLQPRPGRYALITAFGVLEHQTRAELFELLDAVRDGLVPGGCLIAMVPNAKGLFGAHVRFADITHELSFAPTSVVQMCAVAGFEPVAILEHGPVVHGLTSAIRWAVWQVIRAGLLLARMAEGADWRFPVFTQDLVFVARTPLTPPARPTSRNNQ